MKYRYLVTTLIFSTLLLSSIWIFSGPSSNRVKSGLCGTWRLPPSGSLVTLHSDGTADDHSRDSSAYRYRWSVSENVLQIEQIRDGQSLMQTVENSIERFVGDSRLEKYKIIKIETESLVLENEVDHSTFQWIRENVITPEGQD